MKHFILFLMFLANAIGALKARKEETHGRAGGKQGLFEINKCSSRFGEKHHPYVLDLMLTTNEYCNKFSGGANTTTLLVFCAKIITSLSCLWQNSHQFANNIKHDLVGPTTDGPKA